MIATARESVSNLVGLVVGDGPDRVKLTNEARELGLLPEGVVFLGLRDDVPAILRRSDVFVLSSDHEGFPNVLLEAMALGTPCVAGDVTGIPEAIRHGETGLLVPQYGVAELAEAIERLLLDNELRVRLAEGARRLVEAEFNVDGVTGHLREIFAAAREPRDQAPKGLLQEVN